MNKKSSIYVIISLLLLLLFHYITGVAGFSLGSIYKPTPAHAYIMLQWGIFGSIAAICLTVALLQTKRIRSILRAYLFQTTNRSFLIFWSVFVLVAAAGIRLFVLHMMPITDDESCYRFMADLFASGKLSTASHPARLFFDHIFMVNNGELYSQYFIGWPILLIPDRLLGSFGFINAVYAALTIPLISLIGKRIVGHRWTRLTVILFATSPLVLAGAATQLSHTSMIMMLAASVYSFLKAKESGSNLFTIMFIVSSMMAFFIRPYTAVSFLLPLAIWWALLYFKEPSIGKTIVYGGAILAGTLLLAAFLFIVFMQTGDVLKSPYTAYQEYSQQNDFRFSLYRSPEDFHLLQLDPASSIDQLSSAVIRLNTALFGWPCSLIFLLFIPKTPRNKAPLFCMVSFMLFGAFMKDPGIDTYGPTHFSEAVLAVVFLSTLGIRHMSICIARFMNKTAIPNLLPSFFCLSLIVVSWLGYIPVKFQHVRSLTALVQEVFSLADVPEEESVIFVSHPAVRYDQIESRGFVFHPPCNDPEMENHVLWANHLTVEDDLKLMNEFFPDRKGYVVLRRNGGAFLLPIEHAPEWYPDGITGGSNQSIDWSTVQLSK